MGIGTEHRQERVIFQITTTFELEVIEL